MSLFSTLKQNAKRALQNNWGAAIIVSFIPVLTSMVLGVFYLAVSIVGFTNFNAMAFIDYPLGQIWGIISSRPYETIALLIVYFVLLLLTLLLIIPLTMGVIYWYYHLAQGDTKPISGVFYFFESGSKYGKAFLLQLSLGIRRVFWSLLFFVLPIGLLIGGNYLALLLKTQSGQGTDLRILFIMSATLLSLLTLLSVALFTAYMNKYFLAPYYLVSQEDLKPGEAIKTSIEHTKGYRFNLLWFILSFFGWYLLTCIPVFTLYTLPYISTSMALYASYIMETKKRGAPVLQKDKPAVEGELEKRAIVSPPTLEGKQKEGLSADLPVWGEESTIAEKNPQETFVNALRDGWVEQYAVPTSLAPESSKQDEWVSAVLPPLAPEEERPTTIEASPMQSGEWVSAVLPPLVTQEGSTTVEVNPSAEEEEWVSAVLPPLAPEEEHPTTVEVNQPNAGEWVSAVLPLLVTQEEQSLSLEASPSPVEEEGVSVGSPVASKEAPANNSDHTDTQVTASSEDKKVQPQGPMFQEEDKNNKGESHYPGL